jgi:hypothetical protein
VLCKLAWKIVHCVRRSYWLTGWLVFCAPSLTRAQTALSAALPLNRDTGTEAMSGARIVVLVALIIILGLSFYYVNFRKKNSRQNNSTQPQPAWWPRLASFSSNTSRLKVIATARLTNRATLHEVQWGEKRILLVSSDNGVVKLDETIASSANDQNLDSPSGAA